MTTAISSSIATMSIVALLALWFFNVYKVLSRQKNDVRRAEDQVRLHREDHRRLRGSPDEEAARRMLETAIQIYRYIENSYNDSFLKPRYRFPGVLMGFRKVESDWEISEEDQMSYICEDCGFVFCRMGEVKECPYCGKQRIHISSEEEVDKLRIFSERQKSGCNFKEKQVI